jgi:putative CocE/NonD family hydrolase
MESSRDPIRSSRAALAAIFTTLFACGIAPGASAQDAPDPDALNLAKFNAIAESDTMLMVPMRDGVKLATDVYLPKGEGPFPVVFVKTPYNFNTLTGGGLEMAIEAVERGYAYVVQNERGRYYSEGEWEILGLPQTDGYDSLSWIAAQEWSSGKVATFGCSSTAEWQLALAAMDHPAHAAMIPMAAGAGIGKIGEYQEQGNWYKGGVHQTLMTVWLAYVQQNIRPQFPAGLSQEQLQRLRKSYDLAAKMPEIDWKKQLRKLPAIDWLPDAGANEGPGTEFLKRQPNDAGWYEGGLFHEGSDFAVPAFWFNSWFDVSQGPNLTLFNYAREKGKAKEVRDGQYVVIAPNTHCGFNRTPEYEDLLVGDLNVGKAGFPYYDSIFAFLDHYLKGEKNGFRKDTPRVQFYTMGQNEWQSAGTWPPEDVKPLALYLGSAGQANSVFGNGYLSDEPVQGAASDSYHYDPMNPVPALGGGVCCNAGAADGGSFDQRGIEARADVLVYTGEVLAEDLEVTGFIKARLFVSSDAKDTDFTVKLVDVHPDGSAWNVDDTILRARYREGYDKQVFMQEGQVYELNPTAMSTSYLFKAGHRIRVEIASSKFPQYERNLNTGGNNYDETEGVVARNSLHHSAEYPTQVVLPVRP